MDRFLRLRIYNAEGTAVQYDNSIDDDWGIVTSSARLDRKIMQSELRFGDYIANMFQIQVYGLPKNVNLKDRKVVLTLNYDYEVRDRIVNDAGDYVVNSDGDYLVSSSSIQSATEDLFTGYVNSSTMDIVKTDRTILAYDRAYTDRDINIATWWNSYWTSHENDTITLATFRTALLTQFNIPYVSATLLNDNAVVTNGLVNVSYLTLGTVLSAICQLQCCCPNINGSGNLEFVTLATTPYSVAENTEGLSSTWKDFTTEKITGIGVYDTSKELAQVIGTTDNVYNIAGNVFLLGMSAQQITTVCTNILNTIKDIQYTPCTLKSIISDVGHKLGDYIVSQEGNAYIMTQSFSGSLLIEEQIDCPATSPTLSTNVSDINDEIIDGQKVARVKKDIDSLEIDYADYKEQVESQFQQTAESITTEVKSLGGYTAPVFDCVAINTVDNMVQLQLELIYAEYFSPLTVGSVFGMRMPRAFTSAELALDKWVVVSTTSSAGSLGMVVELHYEPSTILTNELEIAANDVLYVKTIRSGRYDIYYQIITDGYSHSEINETKSEIVQTANQLRTYVGTTIKDTTEVTLNVTSYANHTESGTNYFDISTGVRSADVTNGRRFGLFLPDEANNTSYDVTKEKRLAVVEGGAARYVPIYYVEDTPLTTQYSENSYLHLVYRTNVTVNIEIPGGIIMSRTIAEGFWIGADLSYSEIVQTKNQIVMKVDTQSGKIVTAALSADPATGSEFKVAADNIDFIANDVLTLAAKNIGIQATNFSIDKTTGLMTCDGGTIGGWNINSNSLSSPSNNLILSSNGSITTQGVTDYGDIVIQDGVITGYINNNPELSIGVYDYNVYSEGFIFLNSSYGDSVRINFRGIESVASALFLMNETEVRVTNRVRNAYKVIKASAFTVQSSRLVKENITPIEDDKAKKLLELEVVDFDYINGDKEQTGLIAEDVVKLIPNIVTIPDDYDEEKAKEQIENGELASTPSIDYSKLTPYLVKMVQLLNKEVEELKAEIAELKKER